MRDLQCLGEALGIIHIARADRELLEQGLLWAAGWPPEHTPRGYAKERSEHEELWQFLCSLGRMRASSAPRDLLFSECDSAEDYQAILTHTYPAVLSRDTLSST